MFQTHELANTPPYEAKLRAPPLLIHHTHIHYLHHLLEHYCCNTFLFFFFFLCFFFFYGTPYLHLSMNMYPICGSSCGLKKWKQNEVTFSFFFAPLISLWDHPKSQNWLFIQLGTGGLVSWGPFVSTCRHLALQIWRKKLALRTNSYQHVISQQHLGHNFWWVFSPR